MRIIIYAGYANNLGDLNFGKKIVAEVRARYPDAEIEFVTSSSKKLLANKAAINDVESFNRNNLMHVTPVDKFIELGRKGDIIIVGPVLTMSADEVSALAAQKDTPIILSSEYDFNAPWQIEDLTAGLNEKGFNAIVTLPTGLGQDKAGIFLNLNDAAFDKNNQSQVHSLFREGLPITGDVIRGGKNPETYLAQTNVTVSYSHNNAERLLSVHKEIVIPDKNSDLIIMGELKNKELMIKILMKEPSPLDKGFSKIIYERVGEEPQIIADSNRDGPVYRIVHTGRVPPEEAVNLRKICGNFSGATGDQSYSEAIATSNIVLYECQTWKVDLVFAMKAIADKINPNGELARAIHLLAFATTEDEYKELATLVRREDIQREFGLYQKEVLATKDFSKTFDSTLDVMVKQVQDNVKVNQENQEGQNLKSRFLGLFSKGLSKHKQPIDHHKEDKKLKH